MNSLTHVGLDVHKDSIAVAVLRPDAMVPDQRTIPNTPEAIRRVVAGLGSGRDLRFCYEAGPTGYDTYRQLIQLGVACDVIAPSLIPRRPGARVKTDRIDARNLARFHRAGELTAIRIPTPSEEAVRDLVRVREDLKADRRRTSHRIKSFLLRQGRRYPGKAKGWTRAFDAFVRRQRFEESAAQLAFDHYLAAFDVRTAQLATLDREIAEAAGRPPLSEQVDRLRCFRGVDTLSATTIATEVCDFRRFASAPAFMSFTGLVPSEHSSGQTERRGSITKTGNAHIRRVLVEAAWSYRHHPAVGTALRKRSESQPPEVIAFCWKAQQRLHHRYRTLSHKGHNVAVVAVARELAGFMWGLMTDQID